MKTQIEKWIRMGMIVGAALIAVGVVPDRVSAAIVLVSDQFIDGGRSNGADPLDTAWWAHNNNGAGAAPTIGTDNTAPLSGNVLQFGGSAVGSSALGTFALKSLASPGEYIAAQFDVRYTANGGGGPVLGLYNSMGTVQAADSFGALGNWTGDKGFRVAQWQQDTSLKVNYDPGADLDANNNTFTYSQDFQTSILQANNNGLSLLNTTPHNLGMRIELASNTNNLLITSWIDGFTNATLTVTGANVVTKTFDEILVRPGMNVVAYIDNIQVTTNIAPEPSTVMLLGLGLLVACKARRAQLG